MARSVRFVDVAKRYGEVIAVAGVNLDIRPGQFVTLLGPSGCGKSTTLNMIAGLELPTEGRIFIGDRDVTTMSPADRDIAMVFQSYALYPHLTIFENIAFPLRARRRRIAEADVVRKVGEAAAILGLEQLLGRFPREVSGGQRQRVALGRAMVRTPTVYLLDEPLSNLDQQLRVQMRSELKDLHQRLGATMLYVTHDQGEALTLSDVIAVMSAGRIEQVGAPKELYSRPANLFVARFLGEPGMNILEGRLDGGKLCGKWARLAVAAAARRPADCRPSPVSGRKTLPRLTLGARHCWARCEPSNSSDRAVCSAPMSEIIWSPRSLRPICGLPPGRRSGFRRSRTIGSAGSTRRAATRSEHDAPADRTHSGLASSAA